MESDEDTTPDDACVDRDGEIWPEHDYDDIECRRCGAEPDQTCFDRDGVEYPEHDYADYGLDAPVCTRCGA